MEPLTFVSSILASLAWPAAVVTIVFILRHPLTELIPLLKKLKYKDFEAEFGQGVRDVAEAAKRSHLPPAEAVTFAVEPIAVADRDPKTAVLTAWRDVERAGIAAAAKKGEEVPPNPSPIRLAQSLEDAGVVDSKQSAVIGQLGMLRNWLAHYPGDVTLSPSTGFAYTKVARSVVSLLDTSQPSTTAHRPPR